MLGCAAEDIPFEDMYEALAVNASAIVISEQASPASPPAVTEGVISVVDMLSAVNNSPF